MGALSRRRKRRGTALRATAAVVCLAAVLGGTWHFVRPDLTVLARFFGAGDLDQTLVQVEDQFDIAPVVRQDTFTNIPGDPMIIPAPDDGAPQDRANIPAPPGVAASRSGVAGFGMLAVMDGELMPRDRQLVATLPSTREEFALFQSERSRARLMNASADGGATIVPAVASPQQQDVQAGSSMAFLRESAQRASLWREIVIEATLPVGVVDLLRQNGFDAATAERTGARVQEQLQLQGDLPAGSVMAVRYRMRSGVREVIQLTLYNREGYVGSLAMSLAGQLVPSADAWADQSLLEEVLASEDEGPAGQQRLLDVIYSAALREDVPSNVVGEALAMMAKVHDLDSFATEDDRLTLVYDPAATAAGAASIVYIAIDGPQGNRACYVVPAASEGYECYAPGARVQATSSGGLVPPVAGVLSQRFVPATEGQADRGRVVWSAPQGGPVVAAGEGTIAAVTQPGDQPGSVEIAHADGKVSRYQGLASLADTAVKGAAISQGAVIGTVGIPPGRDEPGLMFQLLIDNAPVDPTAFLGGGREVLASDAVEGLVNRIIVVESAGNARARNPLSTASGLGQFIESTWLRMMRSYRPDLIATLSRAELLELRFDPELSRQMVRHLAQENEAYLRARGHATSAGRLYLAHFLGPAGADTALRADPGASVLSVMGGSVVSANPFLRGYSISDLTNWADRKMSGSGAVAIAAPAPVSPVVRAYVDAVDQLLRATSG